MNNDPNHKNILIVDDDESICRLLERYLSLYTSDAADDLLCVDLGGRRIIKKKKKKKK